MTERPLPRYNCGTRGALLERGALTLNRLYSLDLLTTLTQSLKLVELVRNFLRCTLMQ